MNKILKILSIFSFSVCAALFINMPACAETLEFAQINNTAYNKGIGFFDKYLYFLKLSINRNNPKFAVFLGNNIDNPSEDNVIGFMQNIHKLSIPYYIVLGSTDTNALKNIDKETYIRIIFAFNKYQRRKRNYYYFKPDKHFICAVLDDTSNFVQSKHGGIDDEQLEWLDKLLKRYSKRMFIIFQHTPVLPPHENYALSMIEADKYLDIIKKHKNVLIISSGKYNEHSIKQDENGIYHISAPSFAADEHAYQLIKIEYDKNALTPASIKVTADKVKV